MKCPFCDFLDTQVKDSRPSDDNINIKRRRFCNNCGARFTTYEAVEVREIKVIKRSGEKRPLDAQKLLRSLEIATRKRRLNHNDLENIVSNIIKKIQKYGEGEITSKIIGELVMKELIEIDQVAYVRYASVYMDFKEVRDFKELIQTLGHSKNDE
ncbi:transcriptional regulator NrdR [Candidatus Bandiella euplotis]|uniref:Transcriptional repressor NrdR n=1 Tax=Candidatus Bandiella euplotis TaxID=1664265 RepID=A0ABZ0UNR1_9RICK|nr:transcriptional regulator NrdR [Candidatus Bandiella woodruffii]WPX96480.1 NrdR-like transcriptional repressor [Candidatus Bandiella woodruffii]